MLSTFIQQFVVIGYFSKVFLILRFSHKALIYRYHILKIQLSPEEQEKFILSANLMKEYIDRINDIVKNWKN